MILVKDKNSLISKTRKLAAYGGLCSPFGYEDDIKYVGKCSMWNYLENMFVQNITKCSIQIYIEE